MMEYGHDSRVTGAQGSQIHEQQSRHDSRAQGTGEPQDSKNLALQGIYEVEMRWLPLDFSIKKEQTLPC